MNQELAVIIMPNGALNPEWTDTPEPISKSTHLLQKEIFKRYNSDKNSWLLYAGFSDIQIPLSPSLNF
jgi:hypothetical protein